MSVQLLCYLPRVVLYPSPTQRPKPPILSPDLVLLNRRIIVFVLTFSQVVAYRCAVSIKNSEGKVRMKSAVASPVITGPHKPLVTGSSPAAATNRLSQLVTLSTTRRTSEIHHLFSGCLSSHWQALFFLASVILSKIADLPWLFLKSLIMSSSVYSKQ